MYVCRYMLAAAGAVGAGERPCAASCLQPSKLLGSLQQFHPERRWAVHLSSTWIQVKHEFTSLCLFSNTSNTYTLTLCCVTDTCCWWGQCVWRKDWTTRSVSVCLSTRQSVTSRARTHSLTRYAQFYSFTYSLTSHFSQGAVLLVSFSVERLDYRC